MVHKKSYGYVTLFLLALAGCGQRGLPTGFTVSGNGIVNGSSVENKNELRKSVVALVAQRSDGEALCTGSVIDEETILTAAHCVEGNPSRLEIVFETRVEGAKPDRTRIADGFVQNPRWKKQSKAGRGDLALVHFAGGLPKGYRPVVLADKQTAIADGTEVLLIGYGVSDGAKRTGAGVLRETRTRIVGTLSKSELVADGRQSGVCFGDSGGPAFVAEADGYVQWGVASSVLNETCNNASVHTSVAGYAKWIQSQTAKMKKSHAAQK